MKTRFILFFLSLVISSTSLLAQTATAPAIGDGSSGNPYQVDSWQNLYWMSQNSGDWDKYYIQTANIDFADASPAINTWNSGAGFRPIGNSSTKFTGAYDGGGHTITGLYINRASTDRVGLFGYTSGAAIQNTGLLNAAVTGEGYVGGLVGRNDNSNVSNSYSTGSVISNDTSNSYVGGLVGYNIGSSTVSNSYSTGSVEGIAYYVGGLVGGNDNSNVSNSYSTGSVNGGNYVGGLVGYNNNNSDVTNSYYTGLVSGNDFVGGLVGVNISATVSNSFWDTETSETETGIGYGTTTGATGKTTAEMKNALTYLGAGWDPSAWNMGDGINNGYPYSDWQNTSGTTLLATAKPSGSGTSSSDPYLVATLDNLYWITQNSGEWDAFYKQTAEIDASSTSGWDDGTGWTPIGTPSTPFTGAYDGDGHTITALFINRSGTDFVGLFGVTDGAAIQNTGVINADITGKRSTGGLVGNNSNSDISNSYSTGLISGTSNVGGLVGFNYNSFVNNSYSTGSVSGSSGIVGGLVGFNNINSSVSNSHFTGSVSGDFYVGGLVGYNDNSIVSNSYSTGLVLGNDFVGGLMGVHDGGTVSNSFWDTETSGTATGIGSGTTTGATGKTTAQMKTKSTFTGAGWDFTSVWLITSSINNGYAALKVFNPNSAPTISNLPAGFTVTEDVATALDLSAVTVADNHNDDLTLTLGVDFGTIASTDGDGVFSGVTVAGSGTESMSLAGTAASINAYLDNTGKIQFTTALNATPDVTLTLTPNDGAVDGDAATGTLSVTAVNDAPEASGLTFTGTLKVGETLTGDYSYSDVEGDSESGSGYKWYRADDAGGTNKAAISGAASQTYKLTAGDEGKYISFEVTPRDGTDAGSAVESTLQGTVASLFAGGTGTSGDPYQVSNVEQLQAIKDYLGRHFEQTNDIDASATSGWNDTGSGPQGFEPIGNSSTKFNGTYDGDGHTITGLFISRGSTDYVGLFGSTSGAAIENTGLLNVAITGDRTVGGLVGQNDNSSTVGNSYSTGSVSGDFYVGGLVGQNDNSSTVRNSYSTSSVTGITIYIGGLVGYNNNSSTLSNSYSTGSVSGSSNVGGLVGGNDATVSNSFWDRETSGTATGIGDGTTTGATSKTTMEMKTKSTFTDAGWDFDDTWQIDESTSGNLSYPYLTNNPQDPPPGFLEVELPAVVTGEEADAITSSSAELSGEVTDNGNLEVTDRGFVWAEQQNPDTGDNVVTSGTGTGSFSETLSGLPPGTQLYVRAYATNIVGTAYGDPVSFSTQQAELTISGTFSTLNKVYDGDAEAGFDANSLSLAGVYGGHDVSLDNITLSFAQPGAGTDLVVSLTGAELAGEEAGKYTLSLDGAPTAQADITPLALTLAADNKTKVYGEDDPEFTYSVTGFTGGDDKSVLTGSLSRIAREEVGTYEIEQGDLSAGGNYNITFEAGKLSITPKTLEVVADTQSKAYGDDDPELGYAASGFALGDDPSILTGTLSREAGEDVGAYAIGQGDLSAGDNYTIDFTGADLTIGGGTLTVTADELSKAYGEADPEFTYSVTGFTGGDDESVLTGFLSRAGGETVGTYEIQQGDLDAGGNYAINFTGAVFTIEGGVLTISAENQTKVYGETDPEFSYSVSGFNNGDDESVLTGLLSRENGENVGEYVITQGDLSAGDNYALNFTGAEFTIESGTLTVTADDETKTYGQTDPELTYTVSGFAGGDDASILTGSLSREEGEAVGEYAITPGNLNAGDNYSIDFTGSALQVSPKTLEIIANGGLSKIAGEDDPSFTFTATGFAFEEDESVLSGSLGRTAGETPGEYATTLGSLSAGINYTIAFTGDVFKILRTPPVTLSATPEDESALTPVDVQVQVVFDQPVQVANSEGIRLEHAEGQAVSVTPEIENESVLVVSHDGLEHLTGYEVVVAAGAIANLDGVGNEGEIRWSFTTIVQAPEQVVLVSPVDSLGSISIDGTTLQWQEDANASSYQLTLAGDEHFESIITEEQGLDQTTFSYDGLEYGTVYYWRVRAVNDNSAGPWSDAAVFATQLRNPQPVFPAHDAAEISIAPVVEWSSDYEEVMHHVELSANPDFEEASGIENVPADFYEASGLLANATYYWRVRTVRSFSDIQTQSGWSQVFSFTTRPDPSQSETEPVSVSFAFGNSSDPGFDGEPRQQDYRMLGLPGSDRHRVDQVFDGPYAKSWKAFYETGAEVDFLVEYTPEDARFTFHPGLGFWILSTEAVTLNQRLTAVAVDEKDRFGIALRPGWNMISNPFQKIISWEAVQAANQISADLYSFNGQYTLSANLEAFSGYYFYNDPAWGLETLHIPYSNREKQNPKLMKKDVSEEPPFLALEITYPEGTSSTVEFALPGSAAKTAVFTKPHPSLEYARLGAVVTDDSGTRSAYRRVLAEEEKPRLLQVKAPAGTYATWSLSSRNMELDDQPQAVLAVNKATNKSVLMESGQSREVQFTEPLSRYEVYAGALEVLQELQTDLLPTTFELSQNYPNPFNPATHIRYAVPEPANVTLEIYDLLGRKVQTLVNEQQRAGWHLVRWDASALASGMYLYRLRAGGNISTKKLTLIK